MAARSGSYAEQQGPHVEAQAAWVPVLCWDA